MKKTRPRKKYFLEIGILAVLLAGVLSVNYYGQFVSTGHAIGKYGILPYWAQSWAVGPWGVYYTIVDEPLIYATTDLITHKYGKQYEVVDFKSSISNITNNTIYVAAKADAVYKLGYLIDPVNNQWKQFSYKPTSGGVYSSDGSFIYPSSDNQRDPATKKIAKAIAIANVSFHALRDGDVSFVSYACERYKDDAGTDLWYCGCASDFDVVNSGISDIVDKCFKWNMQSFRVTNTFNAYCGDGVCETGENIRNACPQDCIRKQEPPVMKGIGVVDSGQAKVYQNTPIEVKQHTLINITCSGQTPGITIAQGQHASMLVWAATCDPATCSDAVWGSGTELLSSASMNFTHYGTLDAQSNDATIGTFVHSFLAYQPVGTGIAAYCKLQRNDGVYSSSMGAYPLIKVVAP